MDPTHYVFPIPSGKCGLLGLMVSTAPPTIGFLKPWRKSPKLVAGALSSPGTTNTYTHLPPSARGTYSTHQRSTFRYLTGKTPSTYDPLIANHDNLPLPDEPLFVSTPLGR
ncbi:hypothetical protein OUZ56_012417 [Daphnia magna]|uniref:Uncharacterized protein n=1 Tax=Daphnia magna TaxID=35525 RepID=A0ABQ9Z329_9CRUS|nr:hypothetical protein OUZ56_012417 [Daphnia magna]